MNYHQFLNLKNGQDVAIAPLLCGTLSIIMKIKDASKEVSHLHNEKDDLILKVENLKHREYTLQKNLLSTKRNSALQLNQFLTLMTTRYYQKLVNLAISCENCGSCNNYDDQTKIKETRHYQQYQ